MFSTTSFRCLSVDMLPTFNRVGAKIVRQCTSRIGFTYQGPVLWDPGLKVKTLRFFAPEKLLKFVKN